MKSVLQAGWLLTVAFGNLIVVIIAEAKFFDSQVLLHVVNLLESTPNI
jgi:dipeptide/tripeptide permease